MKNIVLIILLICIACNGQKNKDIENKPEKIKYCKMDKFDIKTYNENKNHDGIYKYENTEMKVEQMHDGNNGYIEFVNYSAPKFTGEYYTYDENGILKTKTIYFSNVSVGRSLEFDKLGRVIKEIDEDKKFGKIKYTDILKFLQENENLNLNTGKGWYLENGNNAIDINFDEQTKKWIIRSTEGVVTYSNHNLTGQGLISNFYYEVDGMLGKILKCYKNGKLIYDIEREKKKSASIYKTHNGISYTRAEWEAYEEKEYEEYCKRTGKTYTPKDQRTTLENSSKGKFEADDTDLGTPKPKKGFWDNLLG